MSWLVSSTLILIPCLVIAVEVIASIRGHARGYAFSYKNRKDYQILVPIWGDILYLENVEFLSAYGPRVMLCTTGEEAEEFYADLYALAQRFDFQIFKDKPGADKDMIKSTSKRRTTSGSMRDTIIRNALGTVRTFFVVTLDADSTTAIDISYLVGELEHRRLDIASIRIVPSNSNASILTRLQAFEYDVAMNSRFLFPWLVSGACHGAKTAVLRDIMNRHSLFFQGNDVETGILARSLGYKVGHIPFIVFTAVPADFKAWFRQRLAWTGGEFRLFIINFKFIFQYPFFWFYGAIITIVIFPLRWDAFSILSYQLYFILALYCILIFYLHRRHRNPWLILMPIYTLFISLVMTPLGILWYFYMARKDHNYGIINSRMNKSAVVTPRRERWSDDLKFPQDDQR